MPRSIATQTVPPPYPRYLAVIILLCMGCAFAGNHVAARVAFDDGAGVLLAILMRSGGTLLVLAILVLFFSTTGIAGGESVLRHSAAEAAGLAAGDEWLGLDVGNKGQGGSWRLNKLDELSALLGQERQFIALVARDKRLLRLPMKMPEESSTWKLATAEGRQSGWPAS